MQYSSTNQPSIRKQSATNNSYQFYEPQQHIFTRKLIEANKLNNNLKQLYNNLRQTRSTEYDNSQELQKLRNKHKKLEIQVEHSVRLLNNLVSGNIKLKTEVNNSRNGRVIYSNIYKNIQKEIRKYEDIYKNLLIDNMSLEGITTRITQKIQKHQNKYQKDLNNLSHLDKKGHNVIEQQTKLYAETSTINIQSQYGNKYKFEDNKHYNNKKQSIIIKRNNTHHINKNQTKNGQQNEYNQSHKKQYLENILTILKKITNVETIEQIINLYEHIDKQNQQEYQTYLILQNESKLLNEGLEKLKRDFQNRRNKQPDDRKCLQQQKQLQQLQKQLQTQKSALNNQQSILSKKMDINVEILQQQDILYRLEALKSPKLQKKNLDKILQITQKKRSQDYFLLSKLQMHKENIKYML